MSALSQELDPDDEVDATISRTIRALISYQGGARPRQRVITALGCSRSAFYNRLSGDTHWPAAEVKRAADALGVSVATLYDGLAVKQLPHLDSNQKPAGYRRTEVVDLAEWAARRQRPPGGHRSFERRTGSVRVARPKAPAARGISHGFGCRLTGITGA